MSPVGLDALVSLGGLMLVRRLDGPANARPEQPAPIPVNRNRETLLDRARTQLPYRSGSKDWNSYWIKQSHADRSDAYIPTCPTNYRTLGEILYIVRPLVYGKNEPTFN